MRRVKISTNILNIGNIIKISHMTIAGLSFKRHIIAFTIMLLLQSPAMGDELSMYRDFVSKPPLIKKMVFAQSGNLFIVATDDKEVPTPGFVLFNCAIQSNSWYLEFATNAPLGANDKSEGNGFVIGKSTKGYWGVTSDKKLITTASATETNTYVKMFSEMWLNRVEMVRKLGLIYLEPGRVPDVPISIVWTDPTHFKADTMQHGLMTGQVISQTNGLIGKVEFQFSGIPRTLFNVVYGYEGRSFPPTSIIGHKVVNGKVETLWTFLLPTVETGDLGSNFTEFLPQDFMTAPQLSSAAEKTVEAERSIIQTPNGKTVTNYPEAPNYEILGLTKSGSSLKVNAIRVLVFASIILSFVAFMFYSVRKKKN